MYICFTPSSPPDTSPGSLVFYDVVDCDVVSRCSVLSCIAEAGGEARLPEAVTVSDFRTWLSAVPPGAQNRDLTKLDLSTMCTAAKVRTGMQTSTKNNWPRARWAGVQLLPVPVDCAFMYAFACRFQTL